MPVTPTRFSNARFAIYGIAIGVLVGFPVGVRMSTLPWVVRIFENRTSEPRRTGSLAEWSEPPFNLENLTIPQQDILHGGPPKDGIPALTDPRVVKVSKATFMKPNDRVVGVNIGGEQRAYPIRVLNYHEIVNDVVGGVPIAAVYCPLCDSVSVVDRRIDYQTLTFGVSGLLYNSNVLMYDREHDALWSQLAFGAVSGPFAGRTLHHLPWEISTFESWSNQFPTSTIITLETGHYRSYDSNPYAHYFEHDDLMFPVSERDRRLPAKEPVIGIRLGDTVRAYSVSFVRSSPNGRFEDSIDGRPIVFEAQDDGESIAIVTIPAGADVIHTFWFSWYAFYPETELIN